MVLIKCDPCNILLLFLKAPLPQVQPVDFGDGA